MDITNLVVKGRDDHQEHPRALLIGKLNGFLQEAYGINSRISELIGYLRSIRESYLSTAPPPRRQRFASSALNKPRHRQKTENVHLTNEQRDQIDAEVKSTLRDVHAAVRTLQESEKIRQETETALAQSRRRKRGLGALGQWAAGGSLQELSPDDRAEEDRATMVNAHREGVLWYLQRKLEYCGKQQSDMMGIRIGREVEKSKSVLAKSAPPTVLRAAAAATTAASETSPGQGQSSMPKDSAVSMPKGFDVAQDNDPSLGLTAEQLQIFAEENQGMMRMYEDRLNQVRSAEKSLNEISDLQTTLALNLAEQSTHIDQLVQDSFLAVENVSGGNKQLKKATERQSVARYIFYGTMALCTTATIWDLIF